MEEFDNENMIDAEGIGNPVFIDHLNQLKFYIAYRTCRLKVSLGISFIIIIILSSST